MTISVALCTYNGEKYICEQIESILNQTLPVDEIVVCDDGSTDGTLAIIERLKPEISVDIRIYRNETNLGVYANFQKTINLCHGDIIFLSDQDDIWLPKKVDTVTKYLDQNPQISVVFTDGILSDDSQTNNGSLWQCMGLTPQARKAIDDGFGIELFANESRATGATMAVRRSFVLLNILSSFSPTNFLHDELLAMLALSQNQLGYIDEKLIQYRIHSQQECGLGNRLTEPAGSDIRDTSALASLWSRLALPSPLSKRICFIATRHRRKHQLLGPFRLLKIIPLYHKFYKDRWPSFFLYDLHQWGDTMLHKILH